MGKERGDRVERPPERAEDRAGTEAVEAAWSKLAADPKVAKMERTLDSKIDSMEVSEGDKRALKTMTHALAEGKIDELSKCVKNLKPEDLKRLAGELDELFLKNGMKMGVRWDAKNGVLEIEDRGTDRASLIIPKDGKPMAEPDGVPYADIKDSGGPSEMQRSMMEDGAERYAKRMAKAMQERFAKRHATTEVRF
ncbi:MAG TPA: hypothetical protein V6D08_18665 [Candidatus Obscuribacterales bacterium]